MAGDMAVSSVRILYGQTGLFFKICGVNGAFVAQMNIIRAEELPQFWDVSNGLSPFGIHPSLRQPR